VKKRTADNVSAFLQPAALAQVRTGARPVGDAGRDERRLSAGVHRRQTGYSSGKWEGDTLVVNSIGFRDDLWIDWNGSVITTAAKVQERIRRPDNGHLEVGVTVDDPTAYTKPWSTTLHQRIALNTELVDEICLENEKSMQRMK
jgi:hypothetical protein